jgi:hypothetical protein
LQVHPRLLRVGAVSGPDKEDCMKRINKMNSIWFVAIFVVVLLWHPMMASSSEKKIVGLIEKVKICPSGLEFKAKLDTGARNSSLGVSQTVEFERNGEEWIRFDAANLKGEKRTIERKIIKRVRIKRHKTESVRRYVIKLGVCLGEYYREVEVNLEDRTGFNYRMLVGRSFIEGVFIVDPSLNFTTQPRCREPCGN